MIEDNIFWAIANNKDEFRKLLSLEQLKPKSEINGEEPIFIQVLVKKMIDGNYFYPEDKVKNIYERTDEILKFADNYFHAKEMTRRRRYV